MTSDDGYFGEEVAAIYDRDTRAFDPAVVDPMVERLAELADGKPTLEFGIGTGRIALPLSERGIPVKGIDLSRAMIARLREKPGNAAIETVVGDFATTAVDGHFHLVFLIFNTINNLVTQEQQIACFANAARHLQPGGRFVIEVGVPRLQHLPPGETLLMFDRSDDHWGADEYNVVDQTFFSHHIRVVDGVAHQISTPFRYVWPSELDLMARLAGLRLAERWGGWDKQAFTADSGMHVSVWEKLAQPDD